jgi:NAD(P)-dependent dehydrogenase (short-subunit alcohol dehydrogenase family)
MPPLQSQIALVTGAARGVGAATSVRLASLGAHVLLVARDTERLNTVRDQIVANGGQATVLICDLTDASAIANLGEHVAREYKRCDILVNNAGIGGEGKPLHEVAPEDWDRLFATNLRAPYLTIRALAPLMIAARTGHIINISSLAGRNPLPNNAPYAATKWALNGLTYSVAEELRQYNIRVSVIAPGSINTHFGDPGSTKDPNKKLQPEDVAAVVASIVTQAPQSFISEVLMRPTQKP